MTAHSAIDPDLLFFDRLTNRYLLRAELVARTGFRVGRGRDFTSALTDLPQLDLKDEKGNRRVLVPGSTWKGILRSGAERLLRAIEPRGACDPFHDPCVPELTSKQKKELVALTRLEQVMEARRRVQEHVCLACATFGAPGLASHVRTADCVLDASIDVRDGVAMDRDRGRASDRLKYDFEVVEPGTPVHLEVHLENATPWQVGLVLAMVDDLDAGFVRVGGFGSRGLGWLEVRSREVQEQSLADVVARRPGQIHRGDDALAPFVQALDRILEA